MNKKIEKDFHLPIIIDNTVHIIYGIRTRTPFSLHFSISLDLISYLNIAFRHGLLLLFFFISIPLPLLSFHGRMTHIFTYRIYIYNIYYCQGRIYYIFRLKKKKDYRNLKNKDWVALYISKGIQ